MFQTTNQCTKHTQKPTVLTHPRPVATGRGRALRALRRPCPGFTKEEVFCQQKVGIFGDMMGKYGI
jgi:hypothetical protein